MKYFYTFLKIVICLYTFNAIDLFADNLNKGKYTERCYSFLNQNSQKYIEQFENDSSEIATILTKQKLANGENYRKLLDEGLTREAAHSYRTIEVILSRKIELISVHSKYLEIFKKNKLISNENFKEIDRQIDYLNPKSIDDMLSSFINSKSENIYVPDSQANWINPINFY